MSIPEMPSLCDIWRPASAPVRAYADLACRVVPCLRVIGGPVSAVAYSSATHWIDLPASTYVSPGYSQVYSSSTSIVYVWDWHTADFVAIPVLPPGQRFFLALGVETRYLDTPNEYVRVWAHWVQAVSGFADPY